MALYRAEIEAKLLDVVSERTGYPTDMLQLDADLEGDLGIDSIKRVEVAGSFTADLGDDIRAGIDMEQLTGSRTLREIVDLLERGLKSDVGSEPGATDDSAIASSCAEEAGAEVEATRPVDAAGPAPAVRDVSRDSLQTADPDELALLRGGSVRHVGDEIVFERTLCIARDRYLDHHRIARKAVLPFAAAMELMAETASLAVPDRALMGLDDVRVLKGITVPHGEGLPIKVTTQAGKDGLELMITAARPHYRAVARFAPVAEIAVPAALNELAPFAMEIADAYHELLFHGPLLHGIAEVSGLDARGASATLTPSQPGQWIDGGDDSRWLLDPGLIDSAFQLQVIWGRLNWDVFLLPAVLASCRVFDVPAPGEAVRVELRIRPESTNPTSHANHWLFGADDRLLAALLDVVGVGSKALTRLSAM